MVTRHEEIQHASERLRADAEYLGAFEGFILRPSRTWSDAAADIRAALDDPQDYADGPMRDVARDAVIAVLMNHGYDLPGVADLCAGAALQAYWSLRTASADQTYLAPEVGVPLTIESAKLLQPGDMVRRHAPWTRTPAVPLMRQEGVYLVSRTRGAGLLLSGIDTGRFDAWNFTFIGRPDTDGWVTWLGGENPVPGETVEFRTRYGPGSIALSSTLRWSAYERPFSEGSDIVAFRIAPSPSVEHEPPSPIRSAADEVRCALTAAADEVRDAVARVNDAIQEAKALGVSCQLLIAEHRELYQRETMQVLSVACHRSI